MNFCFKARFGDEKTVYIERSFDVFSLNKFEISNYIAELGGYMDDTNSAVLQSSEDLINLTSKLLSL